MTRIKLKLNVTTTLLVNGGKRSKTGRRKKISRNRPNVKKSHNHGHEGEDDVLWRETVWSLKFRQTTVHPNLQDEATTQTPLSDLSPFLHQLEENSARQESHQTAKKSHDSEETAGLRDGSRGSQEKSLTGRRQNRRGEILTLSLTGTVSLISSSLHRSFCPPLLAEHEGKRRL